MAVKLFELGFLLKLTGATQVQEKLDRVHASMQAVEERTKSLREVGQNLVVAGAGIAAAGAAVGAGIYAMVTPAIAMQGVWAHVKTAMDDGADTMKHLNQVQAVTAKLAASGVVGQDQLGRAYYIARSNMLSHADSLKAIAVASTLVTATTENAVQAQEQMMPTTRTLTTLVKNFGGSLAGYGDQLAKLQTAYSFQDIGEVTNALQYAMPVTMAAGVAVSQMNTTLALLSVSGFHGAEAGMRYQELLSKLTTDRRLNAFVVRTSQGNLDLAATLQKLGAAFAAMPAVTRQQQLHVLGFGDRDLQGLSDLMPKLATFAVVQRGPRKFSGRERSQVRDEDGGG